MKKLLIAMMSVLTFAVFAGEKEKLVEQMLEMSGTPKMLTQVQAQMEEIQKRALSPEAKAKAMERITAINKLVAQEFSWKNMKDDLVKLYVEVYTEDEIKGIIKFYQSPLGQKLLAKSPELMKATMRMVQKKAQEVMPKVRELAMKLNAEKRKCASAAAACAKAQSCKDKASCSKDKDCKGKACCSKDKDCKDKASCSKDKDCKDKASCSKSGDSCCSKK